ncbi:MAG: hypothetical protein KBT30_01580, partial [Clostridiales bacterium]|nr:hypothetical protein [Candidatus Apopatousia equi]
GVISSLVGEQYPFIAVKFKTTACNIERNIRNAISCAYKKCHHLWNEVFNENILVCEKKPTNREFICLCVDKILNEIQFVELKQKYA